jgi:CubicO group peptidase (beta-lactamase class C family)
MARTYCCIQTTARDWLQVGRLILGEGNLDGDQVVPREWMRALSTPSNANPNYGYQIWLGTEYARDRIYNKGSAFAAFHSEPFASDDLIYLDGFGGQRVYVSPVNELVIVRTGRAQQDWDDARLPNLLIRGIGSPTTSAALEEDADS